MKANIEPIKIAILAMGGEGGGVLADWIVALGEANGHIAQTTSVPGVAQRTGATIYYVELFPRAEAKHAGIHPVLALLPTPGDVDVIVASELMEAARAVQRGLVTKDRTTLVASTHRVYVISEKVAMGDGRANDANLLATASSSAQTFVGFDMAKLAEEKDCVISSVLFGALAATGRLPFAREAFEQTIRDAGVGVTASLRGFAAGWDRSREPAVPNAHVASAQYKPAGVQGPHHPAVQQVIDDMNRLFVDEELKTVVMQGIRRLIDYQDPAYASMYVQRVGDLQRQSRDAALLREFARHLALWMSYEDTVRVADLKTRGSRFERVGKEVKAKQEQIVEIQEYMHPGLPEVCDTLPAGLGRWLQESSAARSLLGRFFQQGRVVSTNKLGGFLMLYTLAAMRRWRLVSLRYERENAQIEAWIRRVTRAAAMHPEVALEIAKCQNLVKGYSDTHARGMRNFTTVMGVVDGSWPHVGALEIRHYREAALADEHGVALARLIEARVASAHRDAAPAAVPALP
jgi:indolepyruvate ferredoxin oxidoreductase beta subunit